MTETDTSATGAAIRDAIARRLATMPTETIIPIAPDRSRNSQRPARRTIRRTL